LLNIRARQTYIYYPGLDISTNHCPDTNPTWYTDPAHLDTKPEAFCKWVAAHPKLSPDAATIIATNTKIALGMFTVSGDADDPVFNILGQPQLLALTGMLFLAALWWLILRGGATLLIPWLWRFRRPSDSLLFLWMGAFLFF